MKHCIVNAFMDSFFLANNYLTKCEFEPRSWQGVLDTTLCDTVCQ